MEWYLKASDAGSATAMSIIGNMYSNGRGAQQDYGKAMEWYTKAREAGWAEASARIKEMHDERVQDSLCQ